MSLARPDHPPPIPSWSGWGDPSQVPELSEEVRQLLSKALGVRRSRPAPEAWSSVALPRPRLSESAASSLAGVVGQDHLHQDDETRLRHTRGKSTPDLLRLRLGDAAAAPDAVLMPGSEDEVLEVLKICTRQRLAAVPFGGGTSVVGGLAPASAEFAATIALDLRRMDALLALDEISRLAELEPGLRGPQAEELLGQRGYTIGHFPQSFEYASLGGFAATRSSGQASSGYGRFDELVMALRVATPAGLLSLGRAPRSAAGPDLRQLVLGSEGAFGVITALTLAVRPRPERRVYDGWRFSSFGQGIQAVRSLAQDGPRPTVLRLSDEAETALNLARPSELGTSPPGGCLAVVGYEGDAEEVEARRARIGDQLADEGAVADPQAGEDWARDRYRGPYLRDALLDAGALVETLETVAFWSALPGLYASVTEALRTSLTDQGTPPVILCHVSHVYPTGASLYFTVGAAQSDDPLTQWAAAKNAAGQAILCAGGSITHHHGVGTDHIPWYVPEVGELGIGILRAVKAQLDPAGIMNPGVLLAAPHSPPPAR